MTESYPFPTSADEFADKRVLVTGGPRHRRGGRSPPPAHWRPRPPARGGRSRPPGARPATPARSAPADPVDGAVFIAADIGTAAGADAIVSRLGRARHPGEQRRRRPDQVAPRTSSPERSLGCAPR